MKQMMQGTLHTQQCNANINSKDLNLLIPIHTVDKLQYISVCTLNLFYLYRKYFQVCYRTS